MATPGSIIGQITEELGELGKKVGTETAKVPKDIAGQALESLGTAQGKTKPGQGGGQGSTALRQFEETKDQEVKKTIARAALAELAAGKSKAKPPSVWERQVAEAERKKEQASQQATSAAKAQLPKLATKRPRGDLYGLRAKRAAAEMSRNVRQD